ncbi:MAG: hypothetical protein GDYSWBUE_001436 [Candidatus Fervidibacterota bacterium]
MAIGGIAKRYAKALFEVAKEHGIVEEVEHDLYSVWALLQSEKDLLKLLSHPMIPMSVKVKLLHRYLEGGIGELVMNFTELLLRRGRIGQIGQIVPIFRELADEWRGVLHVEVKSAIELTDEELERIREWASRLWKKRIIIHARVDEDIIGGVTIKVGDKLLDLSIKGALDGITSYLKQLPVIVDQRRWREASS